jgi:hypothetical protein
MNAPENTCLQIRQDIDDYDYLNVDSVPESVDYDADQFVLTLEEFIEMFGDCCGDDDDSGGECMTVEGDGQTVENELIVRQYCENNVANYVDDKSISRQRPNNLTDDVERQDAVE